MRSLAKHKTTRLPGDNMLVHMGLCLEGHSPNIQTQKHIQSHIGLHKLMYCIWQVSRGAYPSLGLVSPLLALALGLVCLLLPECQ